MKSSTLHQLDEIFRNGGTVHCANINQQASDGFKGLSDKNPFYNI